MARAYSLDLRERVVAAVAAGESCRAVAARFGVERGERGEVVAAVPRDRQRGGSTDGRQSPYVAGERDWLLARLAEKPD